VCRVVCCYHAGKIIAIKTRRCVDCYIFALDVFWPDYCLWFYPAIRSFWFYYHDTGKIGFDAALTGTFIFSPAGLAYAYYLIPRVVLITLPSILNFDKRQMLAAHFLGAHKFRAFMEVVLPQIMPSVVVAFCLTATVAIGGDLCVGHFCRRSFSIKNEVRDMKIPKRPLKVIKSDEEWRALLTPIQYQITRQHGTERAFSSPDFAANDEGVFTCVCCSQPLFYARHKYDSGSGWPSFTQALSEDVLTFYEDLSYNMVRTEIRCTDCDAHLGHVFPDGPPPDGLRYCVNGHALIYMRTAPEQRSRFLNCS